MKGFAPRAASSKPSSGSKTMRSLSVSVWMRKLSTKVRPRFSHIAAAIALRSPGDLSGKASSRFASARFCRPRRGAMERQSFPESHEAACTGMARAMTTASQSAANSRRRRNPFGNFMRLAGDLEKTADSDPPEFVSYCVSGSFATVSRTVSTMEASSAHRSARAGRAAQAFRGSKYPNEIGPGVHETPRNDLSACQHGRDKGAAFTQLGYNHRDDVQRDHCDKQVETEFVDLR